MIGWMVALNLLSLFIILIVVAVGFFFSSPDSRDGLSTFRVGLSSSVKLLWKHPQQIHPEFCLLGDSESFGGNNQG